MAEQDTPPPTITAMKIPIIKKGEYDIWSMRMRQYIYHIDHNLWDIIFNGDLQEEPIPTGEQSGPSAPPAPKTTKQLAAKRNQERTTSPPLDNEDLQQIDQDNLEEIDIRWQVAMLTVRGSEIPSKTKKELDFKGKHFVSPLISPKVSAMTLSQRKGHFAKECKSGRNQGKRSYGDNGRIELQQTKEQSSQALVAQYGQGGP
ncbi:hypothetical protein Tco_0393785 [Tanacetum coccineum]